MNLARVLLPVVVLLGSAACTDDPRHPTAAVSSRPSVTKAVGEVVFADSQFSPSTCPAEHALASCFSGTGSATLGPLGAITISRAVVSGDQKRDAPSGCEPADTTGSLTDARGGTARITGVGKLCGLLATYSLLVDGGTGSLTGVHVTGTITNNGGAETWHVDNLVAPHVG